MTARSLPLRELPGPELDVPRPVVYVTLDSTFYGARFGTMDLTKDVEPVTALKRSAADLIGRATERRSPIVITQNGKPTAVLQDVASYERQRRALHLLKLMEQGERDYHEGRVHDTDAVDAAVREQLAALRTEA